MATLTVWVPPTITSQPQSRTNIFGTDASFSVTASGIPAPAYQWQFNGVPIPGASGSTLLRSAVLFAHAGAYCVVLTNAAGTVTSAVATLTVVCPSIALSPASLPGATASYAYNQSFIAGGGTAPYAYSVASGSLPPGLTLSTAGLLSGTPASVGSFDFVVRAADTNTCWQSKSYTLLVGCPAITVGPAALLNGMAGNAYQQTLTASGGYGPHTFALATGTLPAGFSLSTAGVLSGIPAAAGTNSFTVRATDTNGCSGSQFYVLAVTGTPPVITQQPTDLSVLAGASATFTVAASSTLSLGYQWQFNWVNVAGATGTSLILNSVQSSNAGPYRVIVSNAAGAVSSAVATLDVLAPSACVALPGGLVGWWPADGNANDLSGTNHGILQGGASASAAGLVGSAFRFRRH